MTTPIRMSRAELFKASGLLSAHCQLVDGFAVYEEGWNDQRIAAETSPRLTLNSIQKLRSEAIGQLRRSPEPKNERVDDIERNFADLLVKYNDLIIKHNKLVDTLSVNKIIDVRHLRVA